MVLALFLTVIWPTPEVLQPGGWPKQKEALFAFLRKPFETNSETHETADLAHRVDQGKYDQELDDRVRQLKNHEANPTGR